MREFVCIQEIKLYSYPIKIRQKMRKMIYYISVIIKYHMLLF